MTPEQSARYQKERKDRNREYVRSIREAGWCVDCGTTEKLEFDHLPGFLKVMDISTLVSKNTSRKKVEAELRKCALRCHPCHVAVSRERDQFRCPIPAV